MDPSHSIADGSPEELGKAPASFQLENCDGPRAGALPAPVSEHGNGSK